MVLRRHSSAEGGLRGQRRPLFQGGVVPCYGDGLLNLLCWPRHKALERGLGLCGRENTTLPNLIPKVEYKKQDGRIGFHHGAILMCIEAIQEQKQLGYFSRQDNNNMHTSGPRSPTVAAGHGTASRNGGRHGEFPWKGPPIVRHKRRSGNFHQSGGRTRGAVRRAERIRAHLEQCSWEDADFDSLDKLPNSKREQRGELVPNLGWKSTARVYSKQLYIPGLIIKVPHHETQRSKRHQAEDKQFTKETQYGDVHSKLRMLIVVEANSEQCTCVPIYSYHGNGLAAKDGQVQDEHISIRDPNDPSPEESETDECLECRGLTDRLRKMDLKMLESHDGRDCNNSLLAAQAQQLRWEVLNGRYGRASPAVRGKSAVYFTKKVSHHYTTRVEIIGFLDGASMAKLIRLNAAKAAEHAARVVADYYCPSSNRTGNTSSSSSSLSTAATDDNHNGDSSSTSSSIVASCSFSTSPLPTTDGPLLTKPDAKKPSPLQPCRADHNLPIHVECNNDNNIICSSASTPKRGRSRGCGDESSSRSSSSSLSLGDSDTLVDGSSETRSGDEQDEKG